MKMIGVQATSGRYLSLELKTIVSLEIRVNICAHVWENGEVLDVSQYHTR